MKTKNKIFEEDKEPTVLTTQQDLKKTLKTLGTDAKANVMVLPDDGKLIENDIDVIEPKDPETIKYLSNVVDSKTGEISKPFTISGKQYQVVRGITPSQNVVMGVYCYDETDEQGENKIYPIQHFEKNIAKPAKDLIEGELVNQKESQPSNSLNLNEYKHFIVSESGKIRKYKTLEELAKANMQENEKYMGLSEFKKYVYERLFGQRNKVRKENNIIKVRDLNNG
jgi:hypothetical protein